MDVTIHHLRCFLTAARELHFGRAAAELHLSPSSLSEQIKTLERRVSRPLFQRTSRAVELTEYGAELLPLAARAVGAMDEVVLWAQGEVADPVVRVGLMVSHPEFSRIMSVAAERIPNVRWRIRQLGFLSCYSALEAGTVDCVFTAEIGPVPHPQFESRALWDEGCVLVTSERHRLADRESVSLADLADETFVTAEDEETSARWFSAVHADGRSPRLLSLARGFEEILELCAAGLGVNIAGESARVTHARADVRYIPIADGPRATTYLHLRAGRHPAPLERFVRVCLDVAG